MKMFFLVILCQIFFLNCGFAPLTFVVTSGNFFKQIQYLSSYDRVNCFNSYYQLDSYRITGLRRYEAPLGIYLDFGSTYVVCDPQQLFKLYGSYEWIRACDIEAGCLLLDVYLQPVRVTKARFINEACYFYKFTVPFVGYYNFFVTDLMINVCNY